jgi:predicted lipid-binding transport protein (Tim44 family)
VPPAADKKVIPLPNRSAETASQPAGEIPAAERWKGVAEPGSALARGLDAIVAADPTFDIKHFITGARAAYEMIVTAFAEGDRRTLKNLLSREVYDNFDSAITGREQRGETVESRFVAINSADTVAAEQRDTSAPLTFRFVSQLVSVTRNKDGEVIDGNAEKVTDVTDVWTFVRDVSSRDPNWKLVATEAGR